MSNQDGDRERFTERALVSRATVLILGMLLIGMGLGALIPAERTGLCLLIGLFALVAYGALEVAAYYRLRRIASTRRVAADRQLGRRMRVEAYVARRHHDGRPMDGFLDTVAPR